MKSDQCVSVTELRRKTGKFIGKNSQAEQFVFVGSKPTNVLLTMKRYEELRELEARYYEKNLDFHFLPIDTMTPQEKDEYNVAIGRENTSFVDL